VRAGPERAAILFTSLYEQHKQEGVLFKHALGKGYVLTSLVFLPEDALALALTGLVEVVAIVTHTKATGAVADRILQAGVRIDELRPRPQGDSASRTDRLIRDAAMRGVEPQQIALVLDVPLHTVLHALGRDGEPQSPTFVHRPEQRARVVTRPGGRR
jgi:hypothetical protein